MADADGVNVHERTEELVHIQLDLEHGHGLLELGIVPAGTVHGLWDVFEHKVEVHFIFLLKGRTRGQMRVLTRARMGREWEVWERDRWSLPCHRSNRKRL